MARYGRTWSKAAFGPETTVESFPALTVLPLPETGELTNWQPSLVNRARIASDSSIPMEEQSTRIFGRGPLALANNPLPPKQTCSRSLPVDTIVNTMSWLANSLG